ncbi:conserved hypothetical protein [uncultured Stenotrophomonas sp.]|uniref:DUF4381 domain-containing protein n=1 Tax=uncultured Stenotrophomonas sp. TaxID=165438 RepID=A0A1Y5Q327_9GAMM|nr:conserved hypothetical protein [uncultured Stenotrophomonas sp.]
MAGGWRATGKQVSAPLPLRDVHLPAAPGWWPPAPGWWLLAAAIAVALLLLALLRGRRRRRRQRWLALFDAALDATDTPAARIAAASELLRRAARRSAPQAVHLQGEQWLRFLDGRQGQTFSEGEGRLLLDGGYRRDVDAELAVRLCELARTRFLALMEARR